MDVEGKKNNGRQIEINNIDMTNTIREQQNNLQQTLLHMLKSH